ncbi:hypothetical protein C8R46DRAFT_1226402 [Mycena filopes]|nr:hypothetical protein C8R46DRAFT_1226402 [Mycena filopes]
MSPFSWIPPELWLEIFAHLPSEALPCVHLTNRLFARIVRPLLFQHLEFHPYICLPGYPMSSRSPSGLAIPGPEQLRLLLDRLQFWVAADIAPLVRSCSVAKWPAHGVHGWPFSRVDDPYVLLTALFDTLPSFAGLRDLTLERVHFTQRRVEQLCLIPNLARLELDVCDVAENQTIDAAVLPSLGVSHFKVTHYFGDLSDWFPLLCRDKLVGLDIEVADSTLFFNQLHAGDPWPHVKTLRIRTSSGPLRDILSKFPALETLVLSIHDYAADLSAISDILPLLREYTGPASSLAPFLSCPALRRVIVPLWWTENSSDIPAYFRAFVCPNNVTSLRAGFHWFDHMHVTGLGLVFPHLVELHLEVSSPMRSTVNDLGGALVAQHPALTVLWLQGLDAIYFWRRGREVIRYLHNGRDNYAQRQADLRVLWDAAHAG